MLSHWNNFKVVNSYSIYTSTIRIRPFTTQQLVSLQPKEMAKKIRLALQDTDREACSDWMKTHTFANFQNTWYKLHYDHLAYGGQQIVDFFERTDKFHIECGILFNDPEKKIEYIDGTNYYIERLTNKQLNHELGDNLYYGPNEGIRNKTLASDFYTGYGVSDPFFISVDLSHLIEEKQWCLLHLLFTPNRTFDETWTHVRVMKENKDNYLFENENWRNNLETVPSWITTLNFKNEDNDGTIFIERQYREPIGGKKVQGLIVIISPTVSYWSFSFHNKPDCIEYFVDKYKLKKLNI
eukprot:726388_1